MTNFLEGKTSKSYLQQDLPAKVCQKAAELINQAKSEDRDLTLFRGANYLSELGGRVSQFTNGTRQF